MPKNYPMGFSVDPELHEILCKQASLRNEKVSDFIKRLVTSFQYTKEEDNNKRIILVVPKEVFVSKDLFKRWLEEKFRLLPDLPC